MTHASHTVHTLVGAYALDALSQEERREFEAHLEECDTCLQEVRGLHETAARLGAAAARPAPDPLRERVLAEVSRTRQVPVRLPDVRAARRARTAWPLWLAAAACLVVAVASGVWAVRADRRADLAEARQQEIQSVLTAPDARATTAPVTGGGRGTVVTSRSRNRAVVVLAGVGPAPSAKVYEMWLMGGGAPRPMGTMTRATDPIVLNGLGGATTVGLTLEPAPGTRAPTGAPLFTAPIPS